MENHLKNISALKGDEQRLAEQQEELQAQKEELTAAIEELVSKNNFLTETLGQLQKRNEELDLLLYKASHDLKSPITSLQGLLHLLASDDELTDSQRQLLDYMDQKTAQMNDVLKSLNMLSLASFEKIKPCKIQLDKTVKDAINDLRYLPNFPIVKVQVDYNSSATVFADEQALHIILKCLLANAITYREPTRDGRVGISFEERESSLIIEVADDGDGISSEIGNEIFKMFFRGSERSHGPGLGLYIVKVVVERLKGDIRWISRPGSTTFQVVLPSLQGQINSQQRP